MGIHSVPESAGKQKAMLNLDTHVLIDAVRETLPPSEYALLDNEEWSISSIVFGK